jgi:hypothetical protein
MFSHKCPNDQICFKSIEKVSVMSEENLLSSNFLKAAVVIVGKFFVVVTRSESALDLWTVLNDTRVCSLMPPFGSVDHQ